MTTFYEIYGLTKSEVWFLIFMITQLSHNSIELVPYFLSIIPKMAKSASKSIASRINNLRPLKLKNKFFNYLSTVRHPAPFLLIHILCLFQKTLKFQNKRQFRFLTNLPTNMLANYVYFFLFNQ